jgi:tRNA nucleotidyltransferase/poly(A) polymerase
MADYIYLLENRLSPAQRSALRVLREVARSKSLTVFLVGGAVRDLTSGSPVRDLDVVVQGNALKLKKDIEKAGGILTGEHEPMQALYVRFPGNVRVEVSSTLSVSFPKPGKAVVKPATILEDLRRRDFTANAMALSLNEGSYGLLMDPLNGVADIENRELRLVSNYGFIEDPVRMIRAARLMARLGWSLDEKTQTRYETGQQEGYISVMGEFSRGYETEEIVHEEDPLRVLRRLEADGWMKYLAPYWTSAKVNAAELDKMRDALAQLQMQGIHPETAAVQFPLLVAKLGAKEVAELKKGFPRQGFVQEIEALDAEAKEFAAQLGGKNAALPSQAWRLIVAARPEVVLAVAYATKSAALQAKFKSFFTEWPQARQKMPYTLMQEMRIVPELPEYVQLLEKLFFELMDGKLTTPEEMKAFLEPYSPPAPPPPVSLRRPRAARKEARPSKARSKKAKAEEVDPEPAGEASAAAEPEVQPAPQAPPPAVGVKAVVVKPAAPKPAAAVPAKKAAAAQPAAPAKPATLAKPAAPAKPTAPAKPAAPAKKAAAPAKKTPAKAAVKVVAKKAAAPAKKAPVKAAAAKKIAVKAGVKIAVKAAAKKTPAKKVAAKAPVKAAKKSAPAVKAKAAPAKAAQVAKKAARKR